MQTISQAKTDLYDLEKTGKYFFHGSGDELDFIEPRQAYSQHTGTREPHNEPGVYASPFAEVAIYMAVINKRNCPESFLTGFESGDTIQGIIYYASAKTLQQLEKNKNAYGFVHVIERKSYPFSRLDEYQYITHKKVKPIKAIKVGIMDMPDHIDIVPDPD